MNIGDKSGSGQDHCELVGGSEANAIVTRHYTTSMTLKGTVKYALYGKFWTKLLYLCIQDKYLKYMKINLLKFS